MTNCYSLLFVSILDGHDDSDLGEAGAQPAQHPASAERRDGVGEAGVVPLGPVHLGQQGVAGLGGERGEDGRGRRGAGGALVERYDTVSFSDFSAKSSNFRGLVLICTSYGARPQARAVNLSLTILDEVKVCELAGWLAGWADARAGGRADWRTDEERTDGRTDRGRTVGGPWTDRGRTPGRNPEIIVYENFKIRIFRFS